MVTDHSNANHFYVGFQFINIEMITVIVGNYVLSVLTVIVGNYVLGMLTVIVGNYVLCVCHAQ